MNYKSGFFVFGVLILTSGHQAYSMRVDIEGIAEAHCRDKKQMLMKENASSIFLPFGAKRPPINNPQSTTENLRKKKSLFPSKEELEKKGLSPDDVAFFLSYNQAYLEHKTHS